MNPSTRDKLMGVSVATLATALYRRGLGNQVIQGVRPIAPKGRNMVGAGVVTDGGFRDAASIGALDIPAYHSQPSRPTNLTLHEAIEINGPLGCGDAPVFPGDVIVGDDDCVIVIPAHLADEVADEAVEMTAYEDFVSERVMEGESIIGLYPAPRTSTRPRSRNGAPKRDADGGCWRARLPALAGGATKETTVSR